MKEKRGEKEGGGKGERRERQKERKKEGGDNSPELKNTGEDIITSNARYDFFFSHGIGGNTIPIPSGGTLGTRLGKCLT